MISLASPVETLSGIGPKVLEKLHRLGIKSIGDFVNHFPFRYEDFSNIKKIADLAPEEKATVTARILNIAAKRTWKKRMNITEALLEDNTAPIRAVWFNQPYLTQTLKKDLWVNISGKVSLDNMGLYFSNPVFEILGSTPSPKETLHTAGLIPIYPETQGLTSRWLRLKIKSILDNLGPIPDFLPDFIVKSAGLISYDRALRQIHFPKNQGQAQEAKRRLSFGDLFLLQAFGHQERRKLKAQNSVKIEIDLALTKNFVSLLPFELTKSQKLAAWQILQDLAKSSPMNRLLEGEVGSGKTVVATMAALNVVQNGFQAVFLTPTEILASQHFKTISWLLKKLHREVALLTSSQSKLMGHGKIPKAELIKKVNTGQVDIVIGTHALIQKEVRFPKLALVVVDEQHRFGVEQRAALLKNPYQNAIPHLLSMTATPIPRTLALTMYGDLDLSILKELPQGRKKIITKIVAPVNRQKAYEFIEKQIKSSRQAFVICPLIEESDASVMSEVKSVKKEYEKLSQEIFPHLKIAMLHGKIKPKEKEEVMKNFSRGKSDILVSTSVVEVGIDIPNASVMMIEGADRFGLAQLHQFRGRVGRAEHQSYCFLFTESNAKFVNARLKAVAESEDGFALAEKDLQIRGPGQFFGREQSGLPDLAMDALKNPELIQEVQQVVQYFFSRAVVEDYPLLKAKLAQFTKKVHWE